MKGKQGPVRKIGKGKAKKNGTFGRRGKVQYTPPKNMRGEKEMTLEGQEAL